MNRTTSIPMRPKRIAERAGGYRRQTRPPATENKHAATKRGGRTASAASVRREFADIHNHKKPTVSS